MKQHTIEPVFDENCRVLVLGTMPSVKSTEAGFYYAHPRNRFWPMLAGLFGEDLPEDREGRKELALRHGIGIWDVLQSCDIEGSSDASIRNAVPNDIPGLLKERPDLPVLCNGKKAYELYLRFFGDGTKVRCLPSTSPANAGWDLDRLREVWGSALREEGMNREERLKRTAESVVPWFEACGRSLPWREEPTPYHVWVSEIMLQQTRIEAVIPYYRRFLEELPDIRSLAEADPERLQKLWEGLGYYSRVRNLQAAARKIEEEHGGSFPQTLEEIRALPGIGDYTAGAIASICFGLPAPAVDGNVLRVLSRITGDPRPVTSEKTRRDVRAEWAAAYPAEKAGLLTEGIMELGETVCLPNGAPSCGTCPCAPLCVSKDGGWKQLPVKEKKKARRVEDLTLFLLRCGDRIALRRRPDRGLLAGQWELPNVSGQLLPEQVLEQARLWGCAPSECAEEREFSHIFTHVEWQMRCFPVTCGTMGKDFLWVDEERLRDEISLPTAFRKVLEQTD